MSGCVMWRRNRPLSCNKTRVTWTHVHHAVRCTCKKTNNGNQAVGGQQQQKSIHPASVSAFAESPEKGAVDLVHRSD